MKVLFTDDDADDRNIFQWAFKKAFPELHCRPALDFKKDGAELVDYLYSACNNKDTLPNLIFLDLNMPLKNGSDALREIKLNPGLKHIHIIIFSTSSSEADKAFAFSNGAKDYIEKPFEIDRWIEIIKTACREAGHDQFKHVPGKAADAGRNKITG